MPRLFIAFELPGPVLDAVEGAIRELRKTDAGVRWAGRDHLHVTVRFLGEVPEASIAGVDRMLRTACADSEPLDLEVRGLGTFGGRTPRVVWAGVRGTSERSQGELHRLWRLVDEGASGLGLPGDRESFTAHLTLGRVKDPRRAEGLLEAVRRLGAPEPGGPAHRPGGTGERSFGGLRVEELVLVRSRLTRDGSIYTQIGRAALGPGPGSHPEWLGAR